ncbi:helix-turn-helix transcriptional regulator [Streptomyces lushanensis]|uniref:helix-turn-helix transcriptional regulator n=1 Tax=Streptomyces lushanensis TaxID=1434255 RepID=UPI00083556D8|nr:LuxR family transcriptional regulator [Streptomyces lushanensis]
MREYRSPLVGRHGEVAVVAEVLRSTGAAARTLLLTGGAGTGKTAVLDEVRRAAAEEGAKVLRLGWEGARGPDGTAALADAVCGVLAKIQDSRLPVRIAMVRRARSRSVGRGGELALLSALGEVLADAAQYAPFALIVDDIHRIPDRTASALGLLLRVFRPAGVPVVMAGRPTGPGRVGDAQLPVAADRVVELPPLSPAEVGELIVRRLGGPVEPGLVTAVLRSLGPLAGSPAAVLSVLAPLEDGDGLLELDGRTCLTVPDSRLRLTADVTELGRLGWPDGAPDAGTVGTAAALARLIEQAELRLDDLHRVRSLGGLPEAVGRALDGLVRDRVVTVDRDGGTAFAVPALAAALMTLHARPDLRSLHVMITSSVIDRLGAAAAGAAHPRLADHAAAAGPALDATLAAPLLLAAARTNTKLDSSRRVRAYHSALRHLPPHDTATVGVLRESAALSLRHADHIGVLALGEPLLACLDGPHGGDRGGLEWVTRAWAFSALHEHRSPGTDTSPGPRDVTARYAAALGRLPAAAALAGLGGLYGIGTVTPTALRPGPPVDRVPDAGRESGSGPVPSPAEVALLAAAVGGGAEFDRARRGPLRDAPDGAALDRLRNAAAYGDLAGALEAVLGERYAGTGRSTAVQYHAMVRDYLAGHWENALSGARRIETRAWTDGDARAGQLARALAAEIQLVRGEFVRAREWLDLIPDSVSHPLVSRARLGVRYWSGQGDGALEEAWDDVRRAREDGLLAGVDRLLLRILSITREGDGPEATHRAMEEMETLHEESASPMTREAVLLGRGMVHGDAADALAAYRLVRQRVDVPLLVDCCGCLVEVGEDPRRWLAEATRNGHELGMGRPVRSRLGASARQRNVSLPRRRTAREGPGERDARLIDMVSDGSTNRQIAARLACSEKTVEQRLTRLFRRTGCRSRAELAAAWLDGSLAQRGLVPGAGPHRHGGNGTAPPAG